MAKGEKKMAMILKLLCWVLFAVIYCKVIVTTVKIKLLLDNELENTSLELSVWED